MTLEVFAIYDSKVDSFSSQTPPFFMRTKGEALRFWQDTANDQNNAIHKHTEDYSLMHLGTFDDKTGKFEIIPAPVNLGLASSYVKEDTMINKLKNIKKEAV